MAVTALPEVPPAGDRPVRLRHFARLKLRLLGNGFRGKAYRVLSFVVGLLVGLYLAGMGFLLFAVTAAGDAQLRLIVASLGGGLIVVGSVLLPLIWFGVDDTLDPARFALLPLPRRTLVAGLLLAAVIGVPAGAMLVATTGLVVPAAVHGGVVAALGQLLGVIAALLLCLAAARAVTSTFATTLRSRRVRDLLWVLIASVAALLGPLQLAVISAVQRADWDQLAQVARVVGWTPLGAPYTVGLELAEGRPLAALAKLSITAVALLGLLWWWATALESALAGVTSSGGSRPGRAVRGGPSAQLLLRLPGLRAGSFGALVAREARYWWRDVRRRTSLIMVALVGMFIPLLFTTGLQGFVVAGEDGAGVGLSLGDPSPASLYLTMLLVSALAASALANLFGYDGTAYATHLTIGVPGRRELGARVAAHALLVVPLLLAIGAAVALLHRSPALAPGSWGVLLAGYGTGLAVNQFLSVWVPYALPETSNPFATGTGGATAKSLLAMVGMVATGALATPVMIAAIALPAVWPWVGVPVGAAYGAAAAALAGHLAGDVLDRRTPELLAAVTPSK